MSLSGGATGGKGVDANPVETYDSGDEWDIGVGNLIIDLDADLEKDQQKLEMSGSKEVGLPAPNAVATLPENIKFVTPVPGPQNKEGKSKSKRSKSSKDNGKAAPGPSLFTPSEGTTGKKEVQGRLGDGVNSGGLVATIAPKGSEKSAKTSRSVANSKKEKEGGSSKNKKERSEGVGAPAEKEPTVLQPLALAVRVGQYDGGQGSDPTAAAEQLGGIAIDTGSALNPLGVKSELEDGDSECRQLKKVKSEKDTLRMWITLQTIPECGIFPNVHALGSLLKTSSKEFWEVARKEQMESPVSTPAVLPLHLLVPVVNSDISSPCEQIMVRTRSVGVNTCDVALATEPECLGPCEPGTSVNLEGIVWQETEDGMLVVNVTWRNKTYVGTLLDCTQHDWAPPRFCDSPTSDLEMRNGRGRGKRVRPNSNPPVAESTTATDTKSSSNSSKTRAGTNSKGRRGSQNSSEHRLPPSSTSEEVKASPSSVTKRKSKPLSDMEVNSSSEDSKGSKRVRTNSMGSTTTPLVVAAAAAAAAATTAIKVEPAILDRNCPSPILIDCPHPNCSKKYKHINGLKYHQAHAHTDDDSKPEADGDSEYGEESSLPADLSSCNGASGSQKGSLSPARSTTPKVRLTEPHSPSPSNKFNLKATCKKKLGAEGDPDSGALSNDGSEDGPLIPDETSNDGFDSVEKRTGDKEKTKKLVSIKPEKISSKSIKSARPIAPAIPPQIYTFQAATFTAASPGSSTGLTTTVVQAMPNSPQLKPIQPKPTVMGEPFTVSPTLTPVKDKKKKDKKKKEPKEVESPLTPGKGCRAEEGKSPFRGEPSDLGTKGESLLNGSSDPHQSRLASIKAEADKIYSFTDNAPSPSIGGTSRLDSSTAPAQPMTPLHVVTQNGAEASSVKTNSPAYSDISDAGEDGEGKLESMKAKDPDQIAKEGAKKALFPSQPQNKESPYYQGFEAYYSPGYAQSSPSPINPSNQTSIDSQALKLKKDEEPPSPEVKVKNEACEEKKAELGPSSQQPSVIQQRSNMYMQSLYYNQYAYVPPYGYSEQGYHAHLLSTNPTYRQQYEDQQKQRQSLEQQQQQQQRALDKKVDLGLKEREVILKEEWKQKASLPPTLTKAPSLTDLVKPGLNKAKDQGSDVAKSVIIPKLEDSTKLQGQTLEGLKGKLNESHLGKETADSKAGLDCSRQAEVDPVLWYRQEAEPRMWTYVYPAKYPDIKMEDERWKEERERKLKEERSRGKESLGKEDGKESINSDCKMPSSEDSRLMGKDARSGTHVPVSSPLTQHQSYIPYMHGYSYSQSYDPGHPSYRGMPTVMMQNYPGSYLPSSYSFSPYGSKSSGSEESEKSRASPIIGCKSSSESKALDILQQHASHYKSKSPTISEKASQERSGCGIGGSSAGCSSLGGASGAERSVDRPRSSPSQRLMSTHHHHHHLGYSLLPAQYNLPYATGLSSTAIVASQQGPAPSLYPPPRR